MVFAVTCQPLTHMLSLLCFLQPGPDVSFAHPSHDTPYKPWPSWPCAPSPRTSPPARPAQASKSPSAKTQIKIVAEAESAIAKQITKLQKRRAVYVEEFYGLDGC